MSKIPIDRIPDSILVTCDYCRRRPAIYYVRQDGTRLCEHCIDKYLKEKHIKVYQVKLC